MLENDDGALSANGSRLTFVTPVLGTYYVRVKNAGASVGCYYVAFEDTGLTAGWTAYP
jgi:hypothetical protein